MLAPFERALALVIAKASVACYQTDADVRRQLLPLGTAEIGYIDGAADSALLVIETPTDVIWLPRGTMFTALLLPSIAANLETKPIDIGGGRLVMAGYRDQALDLMARLQDVPEPSIIGGHSMGGAIASLMAQTVPWRKPPRVCVTIAAPMHGNKGFNDGAVVPRMRIEREADPAPRWPPELSALYEQPGGVDWLHGRTVTLCEHRPTLVDFLLSWSDHDIVRYASDIEALPLGSAT